MIKLVLPDATAECGQALFQKPDGTLYWRDILTLDEIDALAAEKIMGWHSKTIKCRNSLHKDFLKDYRVWKDNDDDYFIMDEHDYAPTRNIEQAWMLLEKMDCEYTIDGATNRTTGEKYVEFAFRVRIDDVNVTFAPTAPECITRACLAAAGIEL